MKGDRATVNDSDLLVSCQDCYPDRRILGTGEFSVGRESAYRFQQLGVYRYSVLTN